MRVIVAALFLAFVGCASAQVLGFGRCPNVRPVDDFNSTRFLGRWYELARFYAAHEVGISCLVVEYIPTGFDDYFTVILSGADGESKENFIVDDTVSLEKPGTLDYLRDEYGAYTVAAIKYDDYAWIHGCKQYFWGLINFQYNWLFARDPMRSEWDYRVTMEYLASKGINVAKFVKASQDKCGGRGLGTEEPDFPWTFAPWG